MNHRNEILIAMLRARYSNDDTTNFNVLDFVAAFGSPLEALAYSYLFWPEFIELHGMVFRKDSIEDDADRARVLEVFERYGRDRNRTERDFNLTEVPSTLFTRRAGESTDEVDHALAKRLAEIWYARLSLLFPDRRFAVELLSPQESGGERAIVFYQT